MLIITVRRQELETTKVDITEDLEQRDFYAVQLTHITLHQQTSSIGGGSFCELGDWLNI